MSVYKIVGSILDLSGDVAVYIMGQVRYIRADSPVAARLSFSRAFNGVVDHVSLIGPNHLASIGSAHVYDTAADTMDKQRPGMYRQTGRAIARCVAIKHARAETGATKAMARAMRRIAAIQKAAGLPVKVIA